MITGCVGHERLTVTPGVVINGQVVTLELVTALPPHRPVPIAKSVSVTEQRLEPAVKLAVKLLLTPTGKLAAVKTTVPGAG